DSVAQELFSVRILAGGIAHALPSDSVLRTQAESLERSAATASQEVGAMLLELRPTELTDAGLADALDRVCRGYRGRLGVTVITELEPVQLSATAEHAFLRIAQEALTNAIRHGAPSMLNVSLSVHSGVTVLTIKDNGRGFDPHQQTVGIGLVSMRE